LLCSMIEFFNLFDLKELQTSSIFDQFPVKQFKKVDPDYFF